MLKEDECFLQQDFLQLFCIFLSMPLPTDERFFSEKIDVLKFNIKTSNNWIKHGGGGKNL